MASSSRCRGRGCAACARVNQRSAQAAGSHAGLPARSEAAIRRTRTHAVAAQGTQVGSLWEAGAARACLVLVPRDQREQRKGGRRGRVDALLSRGALGGVGSCSRSARRARKGARLGCGESGQRRGMRVPHTHLASSVAASSATLVDGSSSCTSALCLPPGPLPIAAHADSEQIVASTLLLVDRTRARRRRASRASRPRERHSPTPSKFSPPWP